MTDALDEEIQEKMKELIPLKRFGEPEDVANVVLFLASNSSSYVTGQVLSTCGGMVVRLIYSYNSKRRKKWH